MTPPDYSSLPEEERVAIFSARLRKAIDELAARELERAVQEGLLPETMRLQPGDGGEAKGKHLAEADPVKGKIRGIEKKGPCRTHAEGIPCGSQMAHAECSEHPASSPEALQHLVPCAHFCPGRPLLLVMGDESPDWDKRELKVISNPPPGGLDQMFAEGTLPGKRAT